MSSRLTLGQVIRQRRQELGWTQEELAERISSAGEYVRQSEISRIESGRIALPRRERLERLADVLDLPLGELLARSGWAGAEQYFQADAKDSAPLSEAGAPPIPPERHRESQESPDHVVNEGGRQPSQSTESLAALRRALVSMHEETDRLDRNRERASELIDRMTRCPVRPESSATEN